MRIASMGQLLFALSLLALGLLSLFSADFALVWQPVPDGIPGRALLACVSGALMVAAALGLLIPRAAGPVTFILFVYTVMWLVLLHVPHVIAHPLQESNWGGSGEIATLVGASWILYAAAAKPGDRWYIASLAGMTAIRCGRILFAIGIPLVGLEHLVYGPDTASFVPAWLPDRLGLAYFTGIAHIAAGVAILAGVWPRLAAALETLMMALFTVLVWVPAVMAHPELRFNWTALLMSTVITAAGWIVYESYQGAPWFSLSRSRHAMADLATR